MMSRKDILNSLKPGNPIWMRSGDESGDFMIAMHLLDVIGEELLVRLTEDPSNTIRVEVRDCIIECTDPPEAWKRIIEEGVEEEQQENIGVFWDFAWLNPPTSLFNKTNGMKLNVKVLSRESGDVYLHQDSDEPTEGKLYADDSQTYYMCGDIAVGMEANHHV